LDPKQIKAAEKKVIIYFKMLQIK